jgi:hypothetical protein
MKERDIVVWLGELAEKATTAVTLRTDHICLTAIVARERPVLPPIHTEMDGGPLQAHRA